MPVRPRVGRSPPTLPSSRDFIRRATAQSARTRPSSLPSKPLPIGSHAWVTKPPASWVASTSRLHAGSIRALIRYVDPGFFTLRPHVRFDVQVAQAKEWMSARIDRPFFVFLHTYQVRIPYQPPAFPGEK